MKMVASWPSCMDETRLKTEEMIVRTVSARDHVVVDSINSHCQSCSGSEFLSYRRLARSRDQRNFPFGVRATRMNTALPGHSSVSGVNSHIKPNNKPCDPIRLLSTLISNKTSGSYKYASDTHKRDSTNLRLAHETSSLFLGPMVAHQLLLKFLPISKNTPKRPESKKAFTGVSSVKKEVDIYVGMILVSVPAMPH
jgi:hypothetical protein